MIKGEDTIRKVVSIKVIEESTYFLKKMQLTEDFLLLSKRFSEYYSTLTSIS